VNKIKQESKNEKIKLTKILLLLSIPYIATLLSHNGFLAILPFIREEFALNRTQVGYYSTFFFFSSAAIAIFTGTIVDKIGSKKGILFGVGFFGLINILYGYSTTYSFLLILALFAGVGFSVITPSVTKAVMIEAPPQNRATSMGIMQSGVGVGGFIGAILLPRLGEILGWRLSIQITGLFALVIGIMVYLMYQEKTDSPITSATPGNNQVIIPTLKENLLYFFKYKQFLLTCLIAATLAGVGTGAILSHYTVYLSEDLQMSRTVAGIGFGFFQLGGLLGRPGWGLISDHVLSGDRRMSLLLIGAISGFLCLLFGVFSNSILMIPVIVYVFSFLLGYSIFGWAGVYFITIGEMAGDKKTGIATGIALLFMRVGIVVTPPIFGFIADLRGAYDYSWLIFSFVILGVSFLYYRFSSHQIVT